MENLLKIAKNTEKCGKNSKKIAEFYLRGTLSSRNHNFAYKNVTLTSRSEKIAKL